MVVKAYFFLINNVFHIFTRVFYNYIEYYTCSSNVGGIPIFKSQLNFWFASKVTSLMVIC